jgi:hypothetical protein
LTFSYLRNLFLILAQKELELFIYSLIVPYEENRSPQSDHRGSLLQLS